MKLKDRLVARTMLAAVLVMSLMSTVVTQATLHRALNAEAAHMEKRLTDVVLGVRAADTGYAIDGRSMSEAEIGDIAAQYGAVLTGTEKEPRAGVTRRGREMRAAVGFTANGRLYEIALTTSLDGIYAQNRALIERCLLITAAGLAVFWLLMRGVAGSLLRPLAALTATSRALAAGDMRARVAVETEDEIGELSRQVNAMAQALEDALERRDRLIGDLTHEMKTPVAAVMGHADLIRRGSGETETLRHAHAIYKEAARLDALSRRMMQWILLEKDEIEETPLRAAMLLEDTAAAYAYGAAEIRVAAEEAWIRADKALFMTLLRNLTENALHAGAQTITLAARKSENNVEISVIDDGAGMDAETLKRAEEPFYRADRARSRAHGGAGLGLALVRRIADAHGAGMRITSASGAGTTVTIIMREAQNEEE